jgi:hypothetical protein
MDSAKLRTGHFCNRTDRTTTQPTFLRLRKVQQWNYRGLFTILGILREDRGNLFLVLELKVTVKESCRSVDVRETRETGSEAGKHRLALFSSQ